MSGRRLSIRKRFSLEGLADDWTSACYLEYIPASVGDLSAFQALDTDKLTDQTATNHMIAFAKDHVVSGKGLILNDDGTSSLQDLSPDDVEMLPIDVIKRLFIALTGGEYLDPKASPKAVFTAPSPAQQEAPTATS